METKIIYNYFKTLDLQDLLPKIQEYVDIYNNKFKNPEFVLKQLEKLFNTIISLYDCPRSSDNVCINYLGNFLIHHHKYKEAVSNMEFYMSKEYTGKNKEYNIKSAKDSQIIQSKKRTFWMNKLKTNNVVRDHFFKITIDGNKNNL